MLSLTLFTRTFYSQANWEQTKKKPNKYDNALLKMPTPIQIMVSLRCEEYSLPVRGYFAIYFLNYLALTIASPEFIRFAN